MQGDPVAMAVYVIAIFPLTLMILEVTHQYPHGSSKSSAYADDLTAAGTVKGIKYWWEQLCNLGPKFGCFPDATKSWLTVKVKTEGKAKEIIGGSGVLITTNGKRHVEASLVSDKYKKKYLAFNANERVKKLGILSDIAKNSTAYSAFIKGFHHKVTYYMYTIKRASTQLRRVEKSDLNRTHNIYYWKSNLQQRREKVALTPT